MDRTFSDTTITTRLKRATLFLMVSIVFGPFLLARPPDFTGPNSRQILAGVIGMVAWGAAGWLIYQVIV